MLQCGQFTRRKMAIFSRSKKDNPSSVENSSINAAAPTDPEKAEAMAIENGRQSPIAPSPTYIDPELEKRVVRKLDKRLVSLVFVLCESKSHKLRSISNESRSPGLPRPLKHRVRYLLLRSFHN